MNFLTVAQSFYQSLDGTDSYVELKNNMESLIASDEPNSFAYSFIYFISRSYVIAYSDQEVSTDFAKSTKERVAGYLQLLEKSYLENDGVISSVAANAVTQDYFSKKLF